MNIKAYFVAHIAGLMSNLLKCFINDGSAVRRTNEQVQSETVTWPVIVTFAKLGADTKSRS